MAEKAAVFASGMVAISTLLRAFVRPGVTILYCRPLYGGSIFSFGVNGGEAEAIAILDRLEIMKLAVSLSDSTIRISFGVENPNNLLTDLGQALA